MSKDQTTRSIAKLAYQHQKSVDAYFDALLKMIAEDECDLDEDLKLWIVEYGMSTKRRLLELLMFITQPEQLKQMRAEELVRAIENTVASSLLQKPQ